MVASVSYDLEDKGARPPTFGLFVLQSEKTLEDEFHYFLRDQRVVLHHTRIPSGEAVPLENLGAMEGDLGGTIGLFPMGARFDVIGYACTSAASVIGEARVSELISGVRVPKLLNAVRL